MARTIRVKLDARSEGDLAVLRNEGHTDPEVIRVALHEAAGRRRRSGLRAEAELAASNPHDLAEALTVNREMNLIAAIWDEDD